MKPDARINSHGRDAAFAAAGAPRLSTNFLVLWGDQNVRVLFGDQPGLDMPVNWHTQITISAKNAEALEKLLNQMRMQAEMVGVGQLAAPTGAKLS